MFPRPVEIAWRVFQRNRDPRALAVVFDRTAPELLVLARHLATPGTDAEDLVQATFVTAIEDAKSHRPGERVVPWLVGILTNHARAARRRARRPLDTGRLPHPIADATVDVATSELNAELRAAIDRLPEAYRPVLRLVCEHGLAAHEIARTLERPAGTVRAQVTRGIDLLRRYLPASLAGSAAVMAATGRGLAAVRGEVLARCGGTATGSLSAVTLGGLAVLHHKVLAALAAAVLVAVGWFVIDPPPGVGTVATGPTSTPPAPASAPLTGAPPVPASADGTPSRSAANDPSPAPTSAPPIPATTGELVVRVVRRDGKACPGIGVGVFPAAEMQNLGRDVLHRASDDRGEVRFDRLATDQWCIDVDRLGTAAVATTEAGETVVQTVTMPDGITVRGHVRDAAGNPSAGAEVLLHGSRAGALPVARCDANGAFEATHLVANVELQARAPGRRPSLAHTIRGHEGASIELDLEIGDAARTVTGRVVDAIGTPVPSAVVALLPATAATFDSTAQHRPQVRASWTRTDRQGRFRCDEVAPGRTIVFAEATGQGVAPAWIEVDTASGDAVADMQLGRGASVTGTVRRDGQPVAGLQVFAWPLEAPRIGYLLNLFGTRFATTAADGTFRIDGLLPLGQSLRVVQGMSILHQEQVTLRDGETRTWDADLGGRGDTELAIVVESSERLPERLVAIVTNSTLRDGDMPLIVAVQANGRAEHRSSRREPVDVVLAVLPGGASLIQLAVQRQVSTDRREVRFVLSPRDVPSRSIRGRLVDAQAAPLAGETIAAMKASADGLVVRVEVVTGADGSFALGPLPAGDYTLLAGSLRDARPVGTAVLTPDRDEDVGDLRRH